MHVLNQAKRHLVAMIILQSLIAGLFLANHTFSTHVTASLNAAAAERSILHAAVGDAQRRIVLASRALLTDDVFKKSIDWQTDHSLRKTLETSVDSVNLSGLVLFDSQCKLLASAYSLNKQKFECSPSTQMRFTNQDGT